MPKQIDISDDGFINMLIHQNGGAIVDELDRELMKGIGAILDLGGKSEITLKISVSKVKNMEGVMTITPEVNAKHPKEPPIPKAMFLTHGNGLSDQQQDQGSLDLGAPVINSEESNVSPLKPVGNQE